MCRRLLTAAVFILVQLDGGRCQLGSGAALRREYRTLSDAERQQFHNALAQMKRSGEYDAFSNQHRSVSTSSSAHTGPGFLPWHREHVARVEQALRRIDPSIAIPYWDSVMDSYLPNPRDSIMFSADFMGSSDASGAVVTGPFAYWRTLEGRPTITRNLGLTGALFTEASLNGFLQLNSIGLVLASTAPRAGCPYGSNLNALEYSHSNVHLWIGGDMRPPLTSANDPIFFVHHAFVDMTWEFWRQTRQTRQQRESVLYRYSPRPKCTAGAPFCGSGYLFCDTRGNPHCVSKVRIGGLCQGFEGFDVCWGGVCAGGRCVQGAGPAPVAAPPPPQSLQQPALQQRQGQPALAVGAAQQPRGACVDRNALCEGYRRVGHCRTRHPFVILNCPRSCNLCGGG